MNCYTVIEIQINGNTPAILTNVYTDKNTAYNKYYTVLAAAATSNVQRHGAYIICDDEEIDIFERKFFDHPIE